MRELDTRKMGCGLRVAEHLRAFVNAARSAGAERATSEALPRQRGRAARCGELSGRSRPLQN